MATALTPTVIDISHHNKVVDWAAIKAAGIQGVILKASDGTHFVDPTYAERRAAARAAGLMTGAYHFARNGNVAAQVALFVRAADPDPDTFLALDWENNPTGPDMNVAEARQFLTLLMAQTKRLPKDVWVYGGNVLKEQITTPEDCRFFSQFNLWLCHYAAKPVLPKAWKTCGLWQYTDKGHVEGMHADGRVDLNVAGHDALGPVDVAALWAPGPSAAGTTVVAVAPTPSSRADEDEAPAPGPIPVADAVVASSTAGGGFGLLNQRSFAKLNDLADQGSRVAASIRKFKAAFWKFIITVTGGGITASEFVDTSKGTGGALSQLASQHPFALMFGTALLVALVAYLGVKLAIEKGLISAHNDGRYVPPGGKA
jgi:lysozyme